MKKRFYFHWNKPKQCWSIHWNKQCFLVEEIVCWARTESKRNKTQPKAVMQGYTKNVWIDPKTNIGHIL